MRHIHVTTLLSLAAFALPAQVGIAQVIFGPGMQGVADREINGRATEKEVYTCAGAPGGSRIRENCETETETVSFQMEQRLRIALKPPELPSNQCGATTTTQYQQRDTLARVSGTLEIADCAAASGAFTVAVVVKDESGANKPLEFDETWQRGDATDVSFTADYPIGENVELVSVRLRGLSCTCGDAADEPIAAIGDPPADVEAAPAAR